MYHIFLQTKDGMGVNGQFLGASLHSLLNLLLVKRLYCLYLIHDGQLVVWLATAGAELRISSFGSSAYYCASSRLGKCDVARRLPM